MSIKAITPNDLRRMNTSEGLILQGCGGDLEEWLNGINSLLTENGILLDGTKFNDCMTFQHDELTCLLFPFDESVKLDMGKLAMWRLGSHDVFSGTWLSDFVPNQLGGFVSEPQKPDCPLIGQDGNIFNLVGIAAQTLRENGQRDAAKEMQTRTFAAGSYDEALGIIGEYVNITSVDEDMDEDWDEDWDEDMEGGMDY